MKEPEYGSAEYLCYELVRQLEEEGRDIPETDFNKFCSLVYEEVASEGVDADLPIYWYQYGNIVDRQVLNAGFLSRERHRWENNSGYKITIDGGTPTPVFDISEEVRDVVEVCVSRIVDRFSGMYGTEHAKKYSYENQAPNDFVIVMNDFRALLDEFDGPDAADRDEYVGDVDVSFNEITDTNTSSTECGIDDVDDEDIRSFLTELAQEFPEDEYSRMAPQFYEWQTVCRQLIRNDLYGELREFQKSFWNTFGEVELRIHHRENIPLWKISKWRNQRDEKVDEFEQELEAKRKAAQKHHEPSNKLDSVAESYDAAVKEIHNRLTMAKE